MPLEGSAGYALAKLGRDVDLIHRVKTGEDEYGENYDDDPFAENPVRARVVVGSDANESRDEYGSDVDADAEVFVPDSVSGITEGAGNGATRVDVDRDGDPEYRVLALDDQRNGVYRLLCVRV